MLHNALAILLCFFASSCKFRNSIGSHLADETDTQYSGFTATGKFLELDPKSKSPLSYVPIHIDRFSYGDVDPNAPVGTAREFVNWAADSVGSDAVNIKVDGSVRVFKPLYVGIYDSGMGGIYESTNDGKIDPFRTSHTKDSVPAQTGVAFVRTDGTAERWLQQTGQGVFIQDRDVVDRSTIWPPARASLGRNSPVTPKNQGLEVHDSATTPQAARRLSHRLADVVRKK